MTLEDTTLHHPIRPDLETNNDVLSYFNCLPFACIDDYDLLSLTTDSISSENVENRLNTECFQYGIDDDTNENINSDIPVQYLLRPEIKHLDDGKSDKQFSMLHINARSLPHNFDQIHSYINSLNFSFSIIGISETWLKPNSIVSFDIDGYDFIRSDRSNGRGGGVGLYVRKDLPYKVHDFSEQCEGVQFIGIEIICKHSKNIFVMVIYRQPKSSLPLFVSFFENILNEKVIKDLSSYIMGDFNIDILKSQDNNHISDFVNTIFSSGFYPLINRPTRITNQTATLIDNIYTNIFHQHMSPGILITDITDHFPIFNVSQTVGNFNFDFDYLKENSGKYRKLSKENMNGLLCALKDTDWSAVYSQTDPEKAYDLFIAIFVKLYDKYLPLIERKNDTKNNPKKPWVTFDILKLIKKKNRLYKQYMRNPCERRQKKYKKCRNKLNSLLRRSKRKYYKDKFDTVRNNAKKTWSMINEILGNKKIVNKSNTFNYENTILTDPKDIAEHFNNYFVSIGSKVCDDPAANTSQFTCYMNRPLDETLFFNPITIDELIDVCKTLKSGKSNGYDDISADVVKYVFYYIAEPFLHVCNLSLSCGHVPSKLKISKVVPIYKKDDAQEFTNYRPISILPCFSKILEKIVHKRLYNFLDKHDVLYQGQYGFRANYSTEMAVIEIHDRIINYLNDQKHVIGICMDLSKAFDSLSHSILLKKLQYYGIRGTSFNWFESYLTDRLQFTVFNKLASSFKTVQTGVPQGSILGPLLFLLYINDVVNACHDCDFILYADDTSILAHNDNIDILVQSLNENLDNIVKWFKCNNLSLNITKTNYIYFHKKSVNIPQNINIQVNSTPLIKSKSVVFLGVRINEILTWSDHITAVCSKISRYVGILYRIKYYLPMYILFNIYNAFILSNVSYCNVIWANTYSTHLHKLFILQKKAIRFCTNSDFLSHSSPIFKRLYTLKLKDINLLQTASLMQRYYLNMLSSYLMNMFTLNRNIHGYSTRNYNKFHRWTYTNDLSKYSLRNTGPEVWNNIDFNNFNIAHNNIFKRQYKKYLITQY